MTENWKMFEGSSRARKGNTSVHFQLYWWHHSSISHCIHLSAIPHMQTWLYNLYNIIYHNPLMVSFPLAPSTSKYPASPVQITVHRLCPVS